MDILVLVGIGVGLAMDAFAVAVVCAISLRRVSPRQIFRFGFHFGLFQGMMPVLGWLAGRQALEFIRAWDHWVAFGLLALVGGKALFEALEGEENQLKEGDPTKGLSLVIFSVATSIDALAVGLSLAALEVEIWVPALIIGITTATLTTFGMIFASKIGSKFGKGLEIAGGLILIGIGLKILISGLLVG